MVRGLEKTRAAFGDGTGQPRGHRVAFPAAQGGSATPVEVKRPSWTPPGIAFPFIWLTITALRAASSLVVFKATGRVLCSPALLVLALHFLLFEGAPLVNEATVRSADDLDSVVSLIAHEQGILVADRHADGVVEEPIPLPLPADVRTLGAKS